MVRVKICGITNLKDARAAVQCGAWALGFIFYKKSPRYISPSQARKIIEQLPPFVVPVGVFVNLNEKAVKDICEFARIGTVQFHGDEEPSYCQGFKDYKIIKAFRVKEGFDFKSIMQYPVNAYLLDTFCEQSYGGSGKAFDWNLMKDLGIDKPYILSGGLNPDNIAKALKVLHPYAVDASSGIEQSPGVKDSDLIKMFLYEVNSS